MTRLFYLVNIILALNGIVFILLYGFTRFNYEETPTFAHLSMLVLLWGVLMIATSCKMIIGFRYCKMFTVVMGLSIALAGFYNGYVLGYSFYSREDIIKTGLQEIEKGYMTKFGNTYRYISPPENCASAYSLMDSIQKEFKCCGVLNYNEWNQNGKGYPHSCFKNNLPYDKSNPDYTDCCFNKILPIFEGLQIFWGILIISYIIFNLSFLYLLINQSPDTEPDNDSNFEYKDLKLSIKY